MLNISNEIKHLYKTDFLPYREEPVFKQLIINFPALGLIIDLTQTVQGSVSLTESLCSGPDLIFGSCESACFKVKVADVPDEVIGHEFTVTQVISGENVPLGVFVVDSVVKEKALRFKEIVAYDKMRLFDVDVSSWYNALSFPLTLKEFRTRLCARIGVAMAEQPDLCNDGMIVQKTVEPTAMIGRDVAKLIGEINGAFGHMDRYGRFKYIEYSSLGLYPSETLYPSEDLFPQEPGETMGAGDDAGYITTKYQDYIVQAITGVQIREQSGDAGITVGTEENPYIVEANFLCFGKNSGELAIIANNMFLKVKNKFYRPHETKIIGLPYLEVGDSINIVVGNDVIESFVFARTLTGVQALTDEFSAPGNEKRENKVSLATQITQLQGKSAVIEKSVDGVKVTVSDLESETESRFEQTATAIINEVSRATAAEGQLSGMLSVQADQILLKVSKGDVSSQLSIEQDRVYIGSNRLVVDSTNFKLDEYGNATFSGNVTGANMSGSSFRQVSSLAQVVIENGVITTTAISGLAGSVEIRGSEIECGYLWLESKASYAMAEGDFNPRFDSRFPSQVSGYLYTNRIYGSSGSESGQIAFSNVNAVGWEYAHREFATASDIRLKYDIHSLGGVAEFYMTLKPKSFRYKDGFDGYVVQTGLIAQQVIAAMERTGIDPEGHGLVYEAPNVLTQGEYCSGEAHLEINYEGLHAYHIQMIQEQQEEIQELKTEMAELKALLMERGVI